MNEFIIAAAGWLGVITPGVFLYIGWRIWRANHKK